MIDVRHALILASPLLLLACDKTEECEKLEQLERKYELAVARAKAEASLRKQTEERVAKKEKMARAKLKELGLDLPETKLKEELDDRIAEVDGATIERSTRMVSDTPSEASSAVHETVWKITYPAKSSAEALDTGQKIAAHPPLFKVITLVKQGDGKWLLELMRAAVLEVPLGGLKPKKHEEPPSWDQIPSELGFCGAGETRDRLEELKAEFEKHRANAEQLSVLLPKVATFEGLRKRAEMLAATELENRRLIQTFIDATKKAKVEFKGLGVERAVVVYEFYGNKKDRSRVEQHLPEDVLKGLKELDSTKKNVVRLSVLNSVANQQIKRSGAFKPGVGHAPEH